MRALKTKIRDIKINKGSLANRANSKNSGSIHRVAGNIPLSSINVILNNSKDQYPWSWDPCKIKTQKIRKMSNAIIVIGMDIIKVNASSYRVGTVSR